MTVYVLGSNNNAVTFGFTHCDSADAVLPYVAIAPSHLVATALGEEEGAVEYDSEEDVRRAFEAFDAHGTVIFFDNLDAAERFLGVVGYTLNRACETNWVNRKFERRAVN